MSTVPVIWAAAAGTPTSNRAAVTHAPQARLAPVASRGATSGATGALPAGPRIHLQGRGGRGAGAELGRRRRRAERVPGAAEISREALHGGDDEVPGCLLGRTFERALHKRLRGEPGGPGGIDEGPHRCLRLRREAGEPRILPGGPAGDERRGERTGGGDPRAVTSHQELPTVTTELGEPNSSSRAAGAVGSASQRVPSTKKA